MISSAASISNHLTALLHYNLLHAWNIIIVSFQFLSNIFAHDFSNIFYLIYAE